MSSTKAPTKQEHKTKKFGKGERSIPHSTQKAKKFYPVEDEAKPRKVRLLLVDIMPLLLLFSSKTQLRKQ